MSLDPALFTLHFLPRQASPSITDLSPTIPDASSSSITPTYTLSRAIRSPKYQNTLLDGLTYTELGSVSAPSTSEKCKSLRLFNPDQDNEVRKAGAILRTEWQFSWQGEKLAINGKGSYDVEIVRKPDPPIKIAIYRPESKKTFAFLQIFDYNIDRCEAITDKRGLEHTIILAIASCLDAEYDERHRTPEHNLFLSLAGAAAADSSQSGMTGMPTSEPLEPNEVVITPLVEPAHIVEHCLNLLKSGMDGADPRGLKAATVGQNLELVVIKAVGEEMAKRAIGIAERVKVGFYRLPDSRKGTLWDGTVPVELFQYVRTSELKSQTESEGSKPRIPERPPAPPASGARPRIKLGGGHSPEPTSTPQLPASPLPARTPPMLSDITIFLSKTKLEEFEAERSQQARLYEEKQSRRLAERLQEEQARQGGSPQGSLPKGQTSRRPMSSGRESPDAARLKPAANRDGRPTSAGGPSGGRNGVNGAQDDARASESVSLEYSCGSFGGPCVCGTHSNRCNARALERQGSAHPVRQGDNIRLIDDHLFHGEIDDDEDYEQSLNTASYLDPDFAFRRDENAIFATRQSQNSFQTRSHDDAFLPKDVFNYQSGSSFSFMRHATWSSRPTHYSGPKASDSATPNHIQRESPRTPLQPSARDAGPASFLVALQDDPALVKVKVKTPDAPKHPVIISAPRFARAESMAALLDGETRVSGRFEHYSRNSELACDADADAVGDAAEAGISAEQDDAEEYESLCEAECGSWYGSDWSCSSDGTAPPPESRSHDIAAVSGSALHRDSDCFESAAAHSRQASLPTLKHQSLASRGVSLQEHASTSSSSQHHRRNTLQPLVLSSISGIQAAPSRTIAGLPPPILARDRMAGAIASREEDSDPLPPGLNEVTPAVKDSRRASVPVKLGRLSNGGSGKKTLSSSAHADIDARSIQPKRDKSTRKEEKSVAGRWSSTPIRDLHEQWAADFRGGSGAVSRRKRGKEDRKETKKKHESREGLCSPSS